MINAFSCLVISPVLGSLVLNRTILGEVTVIDELLILEHHALKYELEYITQVWLIYLRRLLKIEHRQQAHTLTEELEKRTYIYIFTVHTSNRKILATPHLLGAILNLLDIMNNFSQLQ